MPNEKELVLRVADGDANAMKEIFDVYCVRLRYYAVSLTGNAEEAQDIVQEAFLNFWIGLKEKGAMPENLETYLFGILRNRCLMHLRSKKRHEQQEAEAFTRWQHEIEGAMDDARLREELYNLLSQHFSHLTSMQSQVMKLLYLDDLSVQEVAMELNTSENNVRNHKARAIERLREVAEGEILLLLLLLSSSSDIVN
ncbi:MAG: sigma-70 family RNA polymerase sigma factor [Chitinophagaceae bacterium]|nr:sigma-70 family RNA polymerase sigma factor [Chitinophagaceae bacterium]